MSKRGTRFAVVRNVTAVATVGVAAMLAGCSAQSGGVPGTSASSHPGDGTGTVGMTLTLPGGETISTISWTITGPNGATTTVQSGFVNVQNSLTVSFMVAGIPAGSGYTIALSGTSVDGLVKCLGSAPFAVSQGMTTNVTALLQCTPALPDSGTINVNGPLYPCAAVTGVTALPSETTLGHSVSIQAMAVGANPSGVTYAWSAPSGSFDTPNAASANYTCTVAGPVTLTITVGDGPVPDGGSCGAAASTTVQITCDATDAGSGSSDAGSSDSGSSDAGSGSDASDGGTGQALVTSLGAGVGATQVTINQGTAIGEGSANGGTPFMLNNLAVDTNNSSTIVTNDGGPPFLASGNVPDTAFGFCNYATDGGAPTRVSHITGSKFETAQTDPMVPLTPAYFPLVYFTTNTTTGNAFGGQKPIIGLFDWRPKDIDEGLLAAESDDFGKTWYFDQLVLELNPDFTNPIMGGYSPTATFTGCPTTVGSTNANLVSPNGSQADDGWGHATVIQLPGVGNVKTGQMLYMLDRNTNNIPGTGTEIVDGSPLWVMSLGAPVGGQGGGSTPKFPIWNTNFVPTNGNNSNNDMKSISSVLNQTPDSGSPITITQTVGLTDPDGIMAVFPTSPTAAAGSTVTVLWVQKILNGDNTPPTALPANEQCTTAPFSRKVNHDIATVRLATTTDGVHFTDLGPVNGLSDPTTVDYNKTRWVSPRGTLIDVNGDQSRWGLYFAAGNCLDGDSDAFHYIGYAESSDMMNWTVYNDINHPIASINPITTANQATGQTVTIPANPPLVPTQSWFAERLYAPSAIQIDSTHLSMTFAGYGVQTPNNDLLDYRAIGNVVLTVSKALPAGTPNNINTH
jgi:hypothetical protein